MIEYVIGYDKLGMNDVDRVGGKNASLGEMISNLAGAGVQVPGGYATTADAFNQFLEKSGVNDQIYALLNGKFWIYLLDALFYIIPRTAEMISYPVQTYMENNQMPVDSFVNSFIVAVAIFGLAAYLFKKKDF